MLFRRKPFWGASMQKEARAPLGRAWLSSWLPHTALGVTCPHSAPRSRLTAATTTQCRENRATALTCLCGTSQPYRATTALQASTGSLSTHAGPFSWHAGHERTWTVPQPHQLPQLFLHITACPTAAPLQVGVITSSLQD